MRASPLENDAVSMKRIGRNDPCPCGSGRKYKHCCQRQQQAQPAAHAGEASIPQSLQIAIEHHQAGRLPLAQAIYRRILQVDPDQPDALYLLGMIAKQEGNLETAVELLGRTLRIKPDHAGAHGSLGNVLQAQGRLHEAAHSYRKALASKPDSLEAHTNLGNVLQAQGRLDEAAHSYRKALAILPDSAAVLSNLGNVLHAQGRFDEAAACYRKALSLKPDSAEVHSNLGVSLQAEGKLDAALESYRKALSINPDYAAAHFNLGRALQESGEIDAAIESYRRALSIMPDHALIHSNLGAALQAQGRLEDAVASYRKAIDIDPSLVAARNGMVSALSVLVPLWHVPMMNDATRNDAYYSALKAAVTPDTRVLEIGTGSGLLSMMAARLGAREVTTCEAQPLIAATARDVIADNGLEDRIKVVSKVSNDLTLGVDLAEAADVLVSEILSSELLGEMVLASIEDARRRLLKPGGRVIPAAGSIMIALFGGDDIGSNVVVEDVCGFNLRRFNSIVQAKQGIKRNDLNIEMLSDDIEAFRFDFENDPFTPAEARTLRIPVKSAGRCYGIIQWIRLQMDRESVFENHPCVRARASGWEHLAYIFPSPVELGANQVAVVSAVHNRGFPWFSLEGVE